VTISAAPTATSGPLVLADISGYTAFLQSVASAHANDAFADGAVPEAYGILTRLLDGIVAKLVPPYTLSKLEGDAVFAFATDRDEVPKGRDVLVCFGSCYSDFRERVGSAKEIWPCWCEACANIELLDLKTSAPELAGRTSFALVTKAAAEQLEIPLDDCIQVVESHEHYAPLDAHVFRLSA
jgi:hypothetical protein